MVRGRENGRLLTAHDQGSIRLIPHPNRLEFRRQSNIQLSSYKSCWTESLLIRNPVCPTRVFYGALVLWAIVAPRTTCGLPRPPNDQLVALKSSYAATTPVLDGTPHGTSFYEYGSDSEPVLASEDFGDSSYTDRTSALEETESPLGDTDILSVGPLDVPMGQNPLQMRGLDEVVPFLLPMRPFAPRHSVFSDSENTPALSGYLDDLQPSIDPEIPPRFAFYGPQSEDIQVDDCQHFDAFLVSPLPSTLASRFDGFAQRESAQEDGMPYLHHIHGRPSMDTADSEENPRVVVEGGKVTPLWSEDTDDNPVFLMEEGAITVFRLVAPVKNAYDAVASMMLMPIINVDIVYGDGLRLSYRVGGDEGKQVNHQHVDGTNRPVAALDVVYKSCFSIGGDANEAIPLRAELRFSGCEPVVVMWKVVCSSSALLQDVPLGFHLARRPTTAAEQEDPPTTGSASNGPWDPSSVPFPTVAQLRALVSHEGDLVAAGSANQLVSGLQTASLVFGPSQNFVEMFAWCRGCKEGKLEMQVPTVSADLEVMFPLIYNFVSNSERTKQQSGKTLGLVASRPSSHIVLREAVPGSEELVSRLILEFQCKSDGESIVVLDFSFHAFRDVQIFLKKQCVAPASASLRDPSCSSGVLSEDGKGCCLASCGACGGDGCEDREGGLVGCCLTHIHSSALSCNASTAPCVMIADDKWKQELGRSLALPDEEISPHSRLLLAPIWLVFMALFLLKTFLWCAAAAALLVYIFAVCYGLQVLKEPVPVAAAPTTTQLFNAVFLLGGHLRHLYRTRGGNIFSRDGFHSYVPFEERVQNNPRRPPRKQDAFRHTVPWRPDDAGASFIRLTSFRENSTVDMHGEPMEKPRPLEFCDIEAYDSAFSGRDCVSEENLWGDPQGELQAEGWDDAGSGILPETSKLCKTQAGHGSANSP